MGAGKEKKLHVRVQTDQNFADIEIDIDIDIDMEIETAIEIDIDIVIEIDTGREMEDPACGGMAAEAAGREIKILSGLQKLGMQGKK